MTCLVLEIISAPEVLAVDDAAGPLPSKLLQALYPRDVRHRVVAAGDDDGVEALLPPLVLVALARDLPPQREPPLLADLFGSLDRRVQRHEVLVAPARRQAFEVVPDDGPVAERRVRAVHARGPVAADLGDGLLGKGHCGRGGSISKHFEQDKRKELAYWQHRPRSSPGTGRRTTRCSGAVPTGPCAPAGSRGRAAGGRLTGRRGRQSSSGPGSACRPLRSYIDRVSPVVSLSDNSTP